MSLPTEASRSPEQRQYARLVAEIAATLARPADILQAMHARNMRSRPDLAENFTPPRNATEETLAAIWSEILELDQVGVHDNFFRLGGHSLLATQALSRIVPRFRLSLPLQTLFDYPTIAELAELITARTREHANADANIPPILPISRAQPLPLSFAQQRLWFLAQLVPDDPSYNIVAAVRISGALDRHMLQQSLNELVTRHEILRTCFPTSDGHPIQQIAPALQIALPLTDMRHVPEDARLAGVERLASEEFQQPFDLARLPLWRVRVLQMRTDEYVVLFTMHHIISDGWSMGIFVREMLTVLTAFAQNQPSPLPELPIQYADFASWQRQWLRGAVLERQLHYWQQRLAGAPPRLELPTDRPRPPIQSYHGDTEIFTLDAELTERLQTLSQAAGATMFMTLLAAFAVLLSRYSRQTDLVIGSPIANRNHPDIEPLIGFFVNTLAFRIDLSGSPTFTELLGRVRQDAFEAYAHQDIPFEQLVEELHPERSLSHAPIVQVMFAFQNTPIPKLEFPGLTLTPLDIPARIAQFDLTVSLQAAEAGLRGELEYNTDLFERATMLRMIAHFQTLLHGIAANPDRPVAALPLITSAERQQLVEEWNRTDAEYPRNVCLHELFEQQAERAPEATAVIDGDRRMTYRELNVRANQLARRLQDCGVGPDVLVGLCVERSCEMIIGMLGILKAGGAYVPLDHTYPQERLTFLLADSGVPVIVTQHALIDRLPEHQAQVIGLDMVGEAPSSETPSQEQAHHPHQTATAAHLAYVIYTSGSTGEPKGVLISHRAVVNRVTSASKNYRLASSDRVLQFASMSFDVSVEEIFATLLAGATIVLRPDVHMLGLDDFMTFLEEQRISLINIPTSYWHAWVAELSRSKRRVPESLRLVVVGTEQASGEHLATWRRIVPERVRWINAYGPTEATITTTIYAPDAQAIAPTAAVPIGRPIENTRIYLLDDLLQPVPVGVPGELHIGGESLARGYLKRPHLTAEKFSADPFGGVPGARLYKTGDLARYLPDGQIEFLGRVDDQIKIRGFRIESGEIEAILTQHPAVREAVVMAREDTPGDPRLVAYVVVETNADGPKAMGSLLREYLKTKLPDYMLPAAFVLLEALPHTPHGKIDRRALPTVESSGLEHDYAAPRTPLEVALAEIWAEVLGLQHVGIRDNFFEIGGYSMLAFRLVTSIQQQLDVKLPLAHLFQAPTIEALATLLHQNPDAPSWSPLVALQPQGSRPPLFCVHPGGGYVFCYLDLARRLGTEQPFYGLQAQGLEDGQEPLDRIEDMAAQYIDALKTVQPRGPYALAGWSFGGFVAFEMAQQLCAQGQRVSLLALLDTFSPAAYRAIPQKLPENDTEHLITILGLDCIPEFDLPGLREQLRHIEPERQLLHVLHAAQPFYPTPADIGVGETRRFLNVDRSQARSLDRYVFRPYPGAMTLFQASERERDQGWEAFAANSVETFIIPGNHYTIMFEPGISILVERLHACLEHARADYEAI